MQIRNILPNYMPKKEKLAAATASFSLSKMNLIICNILGNLPYQAFAGLLACPAYVRCKQDF